MTQDKRRPWLLGKLLQHDPNDTVALVAFVEGFMSATDCDRVIELSLGYPVPPAHAGASTVDGAEPAQRVISPGPSSEWLFGGLEQALEQLNARFGFELSGFDEGIGIATYGPGAYTDWAMDLGAGARSNRKLSLIVQLSDENDYDGGDVQFLATGQTAPRSRGSLIVYPSYLMHRMCPVSRGTRVALVSWLSGPAFR